jgi:hypothetical protein
MAQARFELRTDSSGDVALRMGRFERIDLKNIADLKSYNMGRIGNRLMHLMEFANGGTLEVTLLIVGPNSVQVESFRDQNISLYRAGNDLFVGPMLSISAATDAVNGALACAPERRTVGKRAGATCIRKTGEQTSLGEHRLLLENEARQLEAEAIALERQPP